MGAEKLAQVIAGVRACGKFKVGPRIGSDGMECVVVAACYCLVLAFGWVLG